MGKRGTLRKPGVPGEELAKVSYRLTEVALDFMIALTV